MPTPETMMIVDQMRLAAEASRLLCASSRPNTAYRCHEHVWNGPEVDLEDGSSRSCSRCGKLAIDHYAEVGP